MINSGLSIYFRKAFRSFTFLLSSEQCGDAVRNTLTTIVPGILLSVYLGLDIGSPIAIGALLASLTDLPGTKVERTASAKWCVSTFFVSALITFLVMQRPAMLLVWLIVAGFCYSMFVSFGRRIFTVGLLNLILISFSLGTSKENPLLYAGLIAIGAAWHYGISTLHARLSPLRSIQHALKNNLDSLSVLLKAKADLYDEKYALEISYRKVSKFHVMVSDQQDIIRMLLLNDSALERSQDNRLQRLLKKAYLVIDLYDLISAINHDYKLIRAELHEKGVLPNIRKIIVLLSNMVAGLSGRQEDGEGFTYALINSDLSNLIQIKSGCSARQIEILEGLIANIQDIAHKICQLENIGSLELDINSDKVDYTPFISQANTHFSTLLEQIRTSRSPKLLFALRVAALFGVGGSIILIYPEFHYGYWILLTISIVTRPTYAVTVFRNRQRFLGTLLGIITSLLLLVFVTDKFLLISIVTISLFGFFIFNISNYTASVHFATIAVVVFLYLTEGGMNELLGSRLFFTVIGLMLAFVGWFLLPVKQVGSIVQFAEGAVRENLLYFEVVKGESALGTVDMHKIRLQRKKAHQALAMFSDTLAQLQKEPKVDQHLKRLLDHFEYLAYRINSHIIGMAVSSTRDSFNRKIETRIDYVQSLFFRLNKVVHLINGRVD